MYEVPDDKNISKVIVTEKCIKDGAKPEYVYDVSRKKDSVEEKRKLKKTA